MKSFAQSPCNLEAEESLNPALWLPVQVFLFFFSWLEHGCIKAKISLDKGKHAKKTFVQVYCKSGSHQANLSEENDFWPQKVCIPTQAMLCWVELWCHHGDQFCSCSPLQLTPKQRQWVLVYMLGCSLFSHGDLPLLSVLQNQFKSLYKHLFNFCSLFHSRDWGEGGRQSPGISRVFHWDLAHYRC